MKVTWVPTIRSTILRYIGELRKSWVPKWDNWMEAWEKEHWKSKIQQGTNSKNAYGTQEVCLNESCNRNIRSGVECQPQFYCSMVQVRLTQNSTLLDVYHPDSVRHKKKNNCTITHIYIWSNLVKIHCWMQEQTRPFHRIMFLAYVTKCHARFYRMLFKACYINHCQREHFCDPRGEERQFSLFQMSFDVE